MLMIDVRYGYKTLLKTIIFFLCILIIPLLITIVIQGYTDKIEKMMEIWPRELIALCGITNIGTKSFSIVPFYMMLIIINMVAMCRCVSEVAVGMMQDEESGLIRHYINQPYTKLQIYIGKVCMAIVLALTQWFEYCIMVAVMVSILCKMKGLRIEDELSDVFNLAVRGMVIVIFMLSISVLFNIIVDKSGSLVNFLTMICATSFFVGNLYKIFDVIGYYMRRLQGNDSSVVFLQSLRNTLGLFFHLHC